MASLERRVAVDAARAAGHLLHREHPRTRQVSFKGSVTNLVTEMDGRSEALVVDALLAAFPDDGILAEEGSARPGRSGRRWIIDPLDGTTNYAHGLPVYAVGIGLERDGVLELGVVYDPSRDELFVGERGGGAWLDDRRLSVSPTEALELSLLATGFPYDIRSNPDNNLKEYATFSVRARAVRRMGSALLDLAYVAAGRFDGFWELTLGPWDVAAAAIVVEEAGGRITDVAGAPIDVDKPRVVASNGRIHDAMLAVLKEIRGT